MSETYTIAGNAYQPITPIFKAGQTFRVTEKETINYIDLDLNLSYLPAYPLLELSYAAFDGTPLGYPISKSGYMYHRKGELYGKVRVRFAMSPYPLDPIDYYIMVLSYFTPIISTLEWLYDKDDSPYWPRGFRMLYNVNSETWTSFPGQAHIFAEFGNPPLPNPEPPPPIENFTILDITYILTDSGLLISIPTSVPCHLWCYTSDTPPKKWVTSRITRGLTVPWHIKYSFVKWSKVEQNEPGDTLYHTFLFTEWPACDYKFQPLPGPQEVIYRRLTALHAECHVWYTTKAWKFALPADLTLPGYLSSTYYAASYSMIFRDLLIPKGAIIDYAEVRFQANSNTTNPHLRTHIVSEYNADPELFSNIADYQARIRTPNPILWDDIEPWYHNQVYYTPNIAAQIQPVIDLAQWESGKAICLFWEDHIDRSDHVDGTTRFAYTYHADHNICPGLRIVYHMPPSPLEYKATPPRYFTFRGTVDDIESPSVGPIFHYCRPGPPLPHKFESYEESAQTYNNIFEPYRSAQTFTPLKIHLLTKVYTLMSRAPKTYPNLYLEIKEAPDDIPTGPILSSGQTIWAVIPESPVKTWIETPMTPLILKPNVKYAIIAHTAWIGAGILRWWIRYYNAIYPRGILLWSSDAGATWSKFPTQDALFQEWGISP